MTAVSNTALTAAQWNQHVRDNFLETSPAKATATGQYFVATGSNAIAARSVVQNFVATSETLSTTGAFTDLATVGPSVTVDTGSAALIIIRAEVSTPSTTGSVRASYAVSGATTIAASVNWSLGYAGSNSAVGSPAVGQTLFASSVMYEGGLNPGSNIFTMKYSISSGSTAAFATRRIIVIPL